MHQFLDLGRYPLERPGSGDWQALVEQSAAALEADGMFDLEGLLRPAAIERAVAEVAPVLARDAFTHARRHNIYFRRNVTEVPPDHPALTEFETVNRTICADQMPGSLITAVYEYRPLIDFLARVMGKEQLFVMDDPLARVNVMSYREGEALNWHFDRSEFTTTLLLQAPEVGGEFEYARDLRSADDPNYDGVGRLLHGEMPTRKNGLAPGTLNVFRGRNTAHRVTPVEGGRARIIAVFSYYDRPGVTFSTEERNGFYGRAQ